MTQTVLITGATSGIGSAVADLLASRGDSLVLAARNADELERIADDLRIRHGVTIATHTFDAGDLDATIALFDACNGALEEGLDGIILCHGTMGDEERVHADAAEAAKVVSVNMTSSIALVTAAAEYFAERNSGFIAAITSVAGDRGRQSNYIYGASKGGLSICLEGLCHRFHGSGVTVTDIKPGFVDTPMTYGREGMFLVATPERVAGDIVRGIERGRAVVYTPSFWRWIMLIIRMLPRFVFHRTKL